jgi:hypothetical protein
MPDPLSTQPEQPGAGSAPRILLLLSVVLGAALLAAVLWYGAARRDAQPTAAHLPFGTAEQAYAPAIRVEGISMERAENYLHQEVTTVKANVVNSGNRALAGVELNVEFFDEMHQVVLRRSLISTAPQPLATGGSREVEISFEHIPSMWDRQPPSIAVIGLQFAR